MLTFLPMTSDDLYPNNRSAAELNDCMLPRDIVGVATERKRSRRVSDPLDIESRHLLPEAAGAEQDLIGRDAAIVEIQLRPLLPAHEHGRGSHLESGSPALDENRPYPIDPRRKAHVQQKQRGIGAVRGENLGSVQDVAGSIRLRGGLKVGNRRSCSRLGHAEADDAAAG